MWADIRTHPTDRPFLVGRWDRSHFHVVQVYLRRKDGRLCDVSTDRPLVSHYTVWAELPPRMQKFVLTVEVDAYTKEEALEGIPKDMRITHVA